MDDLFEGVRKFIHQDFKHYTMDLSIFLDGIMISGMVLSITTGGKSRVLKKLNR